MTANQNTIQKRDSYHHGQLRPALVEAAIILLETQGAEHISLRGIARAVGVSQAAPYSHFKDKDALLAAVAEIGFQRLALHMADTATGERSARARLTKLVSGYLDFAKTHPALFHLMFAPEFGDTKKYPTLAMSAGKSYALFSSTLTTRKNSNTDARFLSVALWSMCQGMATLLFDRGLTPQQIGADSIDDVVQKTLSLFGDKLD